MDRGELHHKWIKVRRFRPAYFAILFVISAVICVFALRHNNLQMAQLRSQVYAADKSGDGVQEALQDLQKYVTSHMNTDLSSENGISPPIQLRYTYNRAREAAIKVPNHTAFYTEAQDYCQKKYPVESSLYVWNSYVACVQDYLASHNIKIKAPTSGPPPALYKFDFASPSWSPDLAGWSLVASVLFLVLTVGSLLVDVWFKHRLKS